MRWPLLCLCLGVGACAANGVPVEQPAAPAPLPWATAQDAQVVFFDIMNMFAPSVRKIVQTLPHAPDGPIAPITVFPGKGSMTLTGNAAAVPTDGERFNLTVALDDFEHPKHSVLSTPDAAALPVLSFVIDSIPEAEHDPHGNLEGQFKGHIDVASSPLQGVDITLTLSGLVYVHTDGTHDLEQFLMSGTMTSPALGQAYTNSYHPF